VVVGAPSSLESMNLILVEALDLVPTSSPLLCPIPSYVHVLDVSLGDIRGYDLSINLHRTYLEGMPMKFMWITFFDHLFNFF